MAAELTLISDNSVHTHALDEDDAPEIKLVAHPRRGRFTRIVRRFTAEERGAVTAEYAIIILAGVAFAGLLVAIMRSNEVREMLVRLVENALGSAGA